MEDEQIRSELIKKYRWAGKIRIISFFLLFVFLLLMKLIGGYSYLNPALFSLVLVEALLNQPYDFLVKRVTVYRLQFYQMLVDIIAISWVFYYLGGIEAPVVSLAYYAVILWAGVVVGTQAVLFAVVLSAFFMISIVLFEHFGVLSPVSFSNYTMPTTQVFGLLFGNISRKRQEESLRYIHRLSATGYLMGQAAHDIEGCLAGVRGSAQVLQIMGSRNDEEKKFLKSIEELEQRAATLIHKLARFSREAKQEFTSIDMNAAIEDALELTQPLIRYSKMSLEKNFGQDTPLIIANKNQIQEVFVTLILNSLDSVSHKPQGGSLTIKTEYLKDKGVVEIIFTDTGTGIKPDDLKRIGEPFFSTKRPDRGAGLGLATAYDIVERHNGKIEVRSKTGEGATFTIQLPITRYKKMFERRPYGKNFNSG